MKAVAAFVLVLCCLAVSHAAVWRCKEAPRLYGACQIDAGVGVVVARTRSFYAFILIGNNWVRLGYTKVRHVSAGHSGIWASGYRNKVYRFICGSFRRVRGKYMKQVDAGGKNHVVGIASSHRSHCLRAPRALSVNGYNSVVWSNLNRILKYISCSASGPCWGITKRNRVVCVKRTNPYNCYFSPWKFVGGSLVMVEISTFGRVYGVNSRGNVYQRIGISRFRPHGTAWRYVPLRLVVKHVSYDMRSLWVVSKSGLIKKCRH